LLHSMSSILVTSDHYTRGLAPDDEEHPKHKERGKRAPQELGGG
jgi:hypothetical protein